MSEFHAGNEASPPSRTIRVWGLIVALLLNAFIASPAQAQLGIGNGLNGFNFGGTPGVYLDIDGKIRVRQIDQNQQLNAMRARVKAATDLGKDSTLAYVSLPRLFAEVQALRQAGKEIPDDLRYLSGLTQIRYVFVYPEEKDLIIAGPAEPWQVMHQEGDSTNYAVGKRTGRPIMQLDDLIVGLRTAREGGGNLFGCGIYPSPESLKIAHEISVQMARASRAERMRAMTERLGPQDVKIFGTRNDTRFAFICVAADYEMKRFALGVTHTPIPNMGHAMDASRSAANKFWFEASYEPLLVSPDGNAFEIRGQRLGLQAGGFDFDPRGATEKAKGFATQFSRNMPALCAAVPLFAELQNVADAALLGNLLRRDRLAEKVGWDNAWIFEDATCPVAKVPVPRTCETVVSFTNGSMVAGGVTFVLGPYVGDKFRQSDDKGTLDVPRQQSAKSRDLKTKDKAGVTGTVPRAK